MRKHFSLLGKHLLLVMALAFACTMLYHPKDVGKGFSPDALVYSHVDAGVVGNAVVGNAKVDVNDVHYQSYPADKPDIVAILPAAKPIDAVVGASTGIVGKILATSGNYDATATSLENDAYHYRLCSV